MASTSCSSVTTPAEVDRAIAVPDAIVGVNNRDLDTLEVDIAHAAELLPRVPVDRIAIAESGYRTDDELRALRGVANGALIGTSIMPGRRSRRARGWRGWAMKVKICGLKAAADAELALRLGATHLGCVVAPDSPRSTTLPERIAIRELARERATFVLVVRGVGPEAVLALAADCEPDLVQCHGSMMWRRPHSPNGCRCR